MQHLEKNILLSQKARQILTILALFLMPLATGSTSTVYGAGGDPIWQVGDTRSNMQTAMAGTVDQNGNILLTGYQQGASDDFYTSKLKADGSGVLWYATRDLAGGTDQGTAVAVDSNGDVVVCGYSFNGNNYDFHTIKYNGSSINDGEILWENTFNGTALGNDLAMAIAIDSLNNIYVGGYSQGPSGDDDFLIIKYGPNGPNVDGTPLWQVRLSGAAGDQDRLTELVVGIDGISATGHSRNSNLNFDYLTAKYAFDSTLIWQKTYDSTTGDDFGKQLAMDGSGNVLVTGYSWNGSTNVIRTVKYLAADGTVDWTHTYNGGFADEPRDIALDTAGDVYLTGTTFTATGFNDIYTAKLYGSGSSKGQTAWKTLFNSDNGNTDIGAAIAVDESGAVYVTGNSHKAASGDDDFTTIKYQKDDGTILWQSFFNGAASKDDKAVTIGLGSMTVYVGGWSDQWTGGTNDNDYYAITYETGQLDPPTSLTAATVSEAEISLTWQDNSTNEDGFKVERKIGALGQWSEIFVTAPDASSYSDTSLTADTRYYYRVRAYSTTSNSNFSNVDTAITSVISYISPSWIFSYNSPDGGNDHATAIDIGPDQHPVVTGYSHADLGGFDYLTIKIDRATATEDWSHRYDDIDSELDVATDVVVDNSNEVIVSGYSSLYGGGTSNTNDIFTMKYKFDGPPQFGSPYLWTDQYNGPAGDDDRSAAIDTAADTSNNVVVVGYGRNTAFNEDLYVIKYDPAGNRLWDFDYDGGDDDIPTSVSFDPNDDIIVAGSIYQSASSWDLFVRKYRGSDGFVLWTVIYDHAGEWDELNGMVVDSAGDVYITSVVTSASGDDDFYTVKYSGTDGSQMWEKTYDGPGQGDDEAVAIERDPNNGDIIVAGTDYSTLGNYDFHIERYSSQGAPVWQKTLDRSGSDDLLTALGIDVSGTICVSGNTDTGGTSDVLAIKYSYEGERIGATQFNGAGNGDDLAAAVSVNRMGEAYVAGETTGADGSKDYLVLRCEGEVLQAPAPLTGLPSYTSIDLAWADNSINEDGFYLQRKVGDCASPGTWQLINTAAPNTVNYSDSGLNINSTYCYQIQSYRNNGESSRWIETQADTLLPSSPDGFTATPINTTQIDLSWSDNTTSEDGFKIERCQGGGCSNFVEIANLGPNIEVYSDTALCENQTYNYRIFAYKTGQWTSQYSSASNTTMAKTVPSLLAAARISEGQINLNWSDSNTDHSRFKIYRCEGSGCSGFVEVGTVENSGGIATSYSDTSLLPDIIYRYQVTAQKDATCSGGWESLPSNVSETQSTLIGPSSLSASTIDTARIDLSWTDNTGFETGSVIERCTGVCDFSIVDTFPVGPDIITFIDNTVCNNSDYSYRLMAEKTSTPVWQSGYSNTASDSTGLPLAPTLLTATRLSEEQITLSWIANTTDESGFELERCSGVNCDFTGPTVIQMNAGQTNYIDSGLNTDTTYRYRLRAVKTSICNWATGFSNTTEAVTTLVTPSNLNSIATNTTTIDLNWTDNTDHETIFSVERCEVGINCPTFAEVASVAVDQTGYTDAGVCNNSTYRYQIKAIGSTWTSAPSTPYSEVGTPAPTAPLSLTTSALSESEIELTWTDTTSDETIFKIERCLGVGCVNFNQIDTVTSDVTSFIDQGLQMTSAYNYRVRASKSASCGWNSDYSNSSVATTLLPPAPSALQASPINTTQIDLSWADNTSTETSFKIERCQGAGCSGFIEIIQVAANTTSFADTTICDPDSYTYRVIATDGVWNTLPSNESSGTPQLPKTPSGFTANSQTETEIDLTWTDNMSDEDGYQVDRCVGNGCNFSVLDDSFTVGADVTTYLDSGLLHSTVYNYRISPYKATCNWGVDYSVSDQATTDILPPSGLVAPQVNTTQAQLSWTDTTSSETGFEIERCEGAACDFANKLVFAVGPDINNFTDSTAVHSTNYSYRLRAVNSTAPWNSPYSNVLPITTPSPVSPSVLSATRVSEVRINLAWQDNSNDETNFKIERGDNTCANFVEVATVASNVTTYSDSGLLFGSTYCYQVRAYKAATNEWYTIFSNTDTATTSIMAPNNQLASEVDTTGINITWTDNSESETGFEIDRCQGQNCDFSSKITINVGTDITNYTDLSACADTTYHYQVRAVKGGEWQSLYSNISEATTLPPGPSHSFSITEIYDEQTDTKQLNLSWQDDNQDETGFKIERCEGAGCSTFAEIGSYDIPVGSAEFGQFSDVSLAASTTYCYRVWPYKNSTCSWDPVTFALYTNEICELTRPEAPTGLAAIADNSRAITINWVDNAIDEDGYEIEKLLRTGKFNRIDTVPADSTAYTNTFGIDPETNYTYRVRAIRGSDISAYSNEASDTTSAYHSSHTLCP